MPFFRVGTSGDPSESWEHTLNILERVIPCDKQCVVITKHWSSLTQKQLERFERLQVTINTSVSALDNPNTLKKGLHEFERLKPFCNSVLRVVTCDFNKSNPEGFRLSKIQEEITKNNEYIDTVFRVSKNNELVKSGIINTRDMKFLGKKCTVSKYNKKTFFGRCAKCLEMCGAEI
jgi:tRNA nucleotidyltransferase/poly(A) polymerase